MLKSLPAQPAQPEAAATKAPPEKPGVGAPSLSNTGSSRAEDAKPGAVAMATGRPADEVVQPQMPAPIVYTDYRNGAPGTAVGTEDKTPSFGRLFK